MKLTLKRLALVSLFLPSPKNCYHEQKVTAHKMNGARELKCQWIHERKHCKHSIPPKYFQCHIHTVVAKQALKMHNYGTSLQTKHVPFCSWMAVEHCQWKSQHNFYANCGLVTKGTSAQCTLVAAIVLWCVNYSILQLHN